MNIPYTVFEAAVAYARGKEEQHRDAGLGVRMYLHLHGVMVEARSNDKARDVLVSWHGIERAQYDALRGAIDKAVAGV